MWNEAERFTVVFRYYCYQMGDWTRYSPRDGCPRHDSCPLVLAAMKRAVGRQDSWVNGCFYRDSLLNTASAVWLQVAATACAYLCSCDAIGKFETQEQFLSEAESRV